MKLKRLICSSGGGRHGNVSSRRMQGTRRFRKTESTATAAGSEAADTAAASEAINKTGYPIMNDGIIPLKLYIR